MNWIRVDDHLPPHETRVLITNGKEVVPGFFVQFTIGHAWGLPRNWTEITHWMPLPAPPEGK